MDDSFQIGGRKFKLNKINAMIQFHVVRRIGPLLTDLMSVMGRIAKKDVEGMTEEQKIQEFALIAAPVMNGLARLSDADSEYVLYRLLAAVEVHQAQFDIWTKVATAENGIMMQDIDFPMLLQVAVRSLMFNLKGFFSLLPQVVSGK